MSRKTGSIPWNKGLKTGSVGFKHKPETIEKMRLSKLGDKNPNYNKPLTEEAKEHLRLFWKGKPKSKEWRANISRGQIGRFYTKEHRDNISRGNKGKKGWNKGLKLSEEQRNKIKIIFQTRKRGVFIDTKPEKELHKILNSNNIPFTKQKNIIGKPDVFIEPNLCLFVDGCYHHWCDIHHPESNDKKEIKMYKINRDNEVNKNLIHKGYKVIRFWEHDIYHNPKKVQNEIFRRLK